MQSGALTAEGDMKCPLTNAEAGTELDRWLSDSVTGPASLQCCLFFNIYIFLRLPLFAFGQHSAAK